MQDLEYLFTVSVPDYLRTTQLRKDFICLQFKYAIGIDVWRKEYTLVYINCSSYGQHYISKLSEYNLEHNLY